MGPASFFFFAKWFIIMASEMHMPPPPFVYPSELPTYIDSYIGTTQRGRGGLDIGENLLY